MLYVFEKILIRPTEKVSIQPTGPIEMNVWCVMNGHRSVAAKKISRLDCYWSGDEERHGLHVKTRIPWIPFFTKNVFKGCLQQEDHLGFKLQSVSVVGIDQGQLGPSLSTD